MLLTGLYINNFKSIPPVVRGNVSSRAHKVDEVIVLGMLNTVYVPYLELSASQQCASND